MIYYQRINYAEKNGIIISSDNNKNNNNNDNDNNNNNNDNNKDNGRVNEEKVFYKSDMLTNDIDLECSCTLFNILESSTDK